MEMNKCLRCGYIWPRRVIKPKACPKCKNYDWQNPKKRSRSNKQNNPKEPEFKESKGLLDGRGAQPKLNSKKEQRLFNTTKPFYTGTSSFSNSNKKDQTEKNRGNL